MNCAHCQDSGVYREAGSPPEVCTCQDDTRFNTEARAHFPTATVADMLDYGGFAAALRKMFNSELSRHGAEWSARLDGVRIPNLGAVIPDGKTKLSALIRLAKSNPEAAA